LNSIIGEWLSYGGRVEYKGNNTTIIRGKNNEWFIIYDNWKIHIIPGKMIALYNGRKWYVSHAPFRRGHAIDMVRSVLANVPIPWVRQQLFSALPPSR